MELILIIYFHVISDVCSFLKVHLNISGQVSYKQSLRQGFRCVWEHEGGVLSGETCKDSEKQDGGRGKEQAEMWLQVKSNSDLIPGEVCSVEASGT